MIWKKRGGDIKAESSSYSAESTPDRNCHSQPFLARWHDGIFLLSNPLNQSWMKQNIAMKEICQKIQGLQERFFSEKFLLMGDILLTISPTFRCSFYIFILENDSYWLLSRHQNFQHYAFLLSKLHLQYLAKK